MYSGKDLIRFNEKKKEEGQTKNIWLAEERTTENKKNTLNAPCRKYVETI